MQGLYPTHIWSDMTNVVRMSVKMVLPVLYCIFVVLAGMGVQTVCLHNSKWQANSV